MKVSDLLTKLKANRYTYYNLSEASINDFKKLYKFLKKNSNKQVANLGYIAAKVIANDISEVDYLRKYTSMQILSVYIIHKQY